MVPSHIQDAIEKAARLIQGAQVCVALTGAGISTPSGIPDFRSPQSGLWTRVNPFDVASLSTFRVAPDRFYNWVRPLADLVFNADPNPAHLALAQLEKAGFLHAVITQNIDGLHQKAGSEDVIEVHGTLDSLTCVSCYREAGIEEVLEEFLETSQPPRCAYCRNILKPNVILFGEQLPRASWEKAEQAGRECDLMLVAGSSLEVTPVARIPASVVERGGSLIIINLYQTYIDNHANVVIQRDLAEVMPLIAQEVLGAQ